MYSSIKGPIVYFIEGKFPSKNLKLIRNAISFLMRHTNLYCAKFVSKIDHCACQLHETCVVIDPKTSSQKVRDNSKNYNLSQPPKRKVA